MWRIVPCKALLLLNLRASPKFHIHEAVRAIDQLDKNRGSISIFNPNDVTQLALREYTAPPAPGRWFVGAEANGSSGGAGSSVECPVVLVGHVGLVPTFAESLSGGWRAAGAALGRAQPAWGEPFPWRWRGCPWALPPTSRLSWGGLQRHENYIFIRNSSLWFWGQKIKKPKENGI